MKAMVTTLRDAYIADAVCVWTASNLEPNFESGIFVIDWSKWVHPAAEEVPEEPLEIALPDWAVNVLSEAAVGSLCRQRRELVGHAGWIWIERLMAVQQMIRRAINAWRKQSGVAA